MGRPIVQYNKAELVAFLEKKCPQALAKFPAPEKFAFERYPAGHYLDIGYIIEKDLAVGHRVYVSSESEGMPQLTYRKLPHGQVHARDHINLTDLLHEVLDRAKLPPYDTALRIVVNFIFVWCGHQDVFVDLQHGSELDCGPALSILVRRLENLAPKHPKVVRKFPLD
jgi:hypothetical protein